MSDCNCPQAIPGVTDEPCPVHGGKPAFVRRALKQEKPKQRHPVGSGEWVEAEHERQRKKTAAALRQAACAWARGSAREPADQHDRAFRRLDRALQRAACRFAEQHPELMR